MSDPAPYFRSSGNLTTKVYDFSDFSRIEAGSGFEVTIAQSDSYAVNITGDDNIFKHIEVSKDGETLKIGFKIPITLGLVTLKAEVTMPRLGGVKLSGATRGTVSGFESAEDVNIELSGASSLELVNISTGDVNFDLSGASKITGDIAAGDADFEISGASNVQLEGSASTIVINASDASRVKLAAFLSKNADVKLSGASNSTINLSDSGKLDANLSGASKLEYSGERIIMGTINTSGASTLSKK